MTATLQAGDVVSSNIGWLYRVREDGNYDSFSEWSEEAGTPVVAGDAVSWPVALMVRDGAAANDEPGEAHAVRMALFLNGRR